ncbi:Oidioi.mRNA.OKI2018_I69.XSR.g14249.t1.cds [Oikopleura dioica]|uniref:Oidioi.mRNA.OKI2018_I69.XSR.g14249.t1.cds n=1 Tax=Oikopleura dioica TaxID=34765 RepID=A0ABN7SI20_OIKDI|nr:Oidioi.mRNA.OKI2018_I69.XSR.g14249.t1.cds [Oikopleura dioica]
MDSSSNDEIICTAKGYFQKEKHISELKIIFRRPSWLITREPRSSLVVELTPHFTHKFFNKKAHQSPLRPKPRSVQASTWYVEWWCSPEEELSSAVGATKFVFATNQAAEARSLDRGLRIAKTSLEKKPQSQPRSLQKNTRYNNYAPDPTLITKLGESKCHDLNNHLKPQPSSQNARCSSCGKPLSTSRRVRCWARLSSILCCTSEFDHLLSEKPAL